MDLRGAISNLLSLGAKLLPAVAASALTPFSFSNPPVDQNHQIKAELEKLMRMLERIKKTFYDAEQREVTDSAVKLWLEELRDVACGAEDVLGEFHYEVLRAQVEGKCDMFCDHEQREIKELSVKLLQVQIEESEDSPKTKLIQVSSGMLDQIQQIRSRFDEITKDRIALQLSEGDGPRRCNNESQIAPTSHFVVESNIFGRESEKKKLIDLLSSGCDVVSVVTLVGMGGIGKTTLAQLVYNDQRIRQKFDKFGWICVSEDFNVERLTKESVESITDNECGLTNLSVLQDKIRREISGKRIILVLDDVWNENDNLWDLFKAPFMSAEFAKILVTTRNDHVGRIMQTETTFNLGYLSAEQCWLLFEHYAFGGVKQNKDPKLVEIGKQIMNKCGLLPLAVKSIASLLRFEAEEESWRDILENELWESDRVSNRIFPSLQISYARLPTHLKPCFLYCSMFPKDYEYNVEYLVELWMSQGFIESKENKKPEKIGFDYTQQLCERSFFEPDIHFDWSHKFKLHDIVHDLARLNSKNSCYSIEVSKLPSFPNLLYHLYIAHSVDLRNPIPSDNHRDPIPSDKFTALRTLIIKFSENNFFTSTFDLSMAPKLRALDLSHAKSESLSSIGHLKHLRFLSLSEMLFETLPECICSLYNLQKLTLTKNNLKVLPRKIGNLINLEELTIESCYDLAVLPESLCQLKSLRELCLIHCELLEALPSDLGNLTNIQTLEIGYTGVNYLPPSLSKFVRIQSLKVKLTCKTIGWLKDFSNLGGTLSLRGLTNIRNLTDVQCANLVSMHNLEHLILSWYEGESGGMDDCSVLDLFMNIECNKLLEYQRYFSVMLSLQPHPNLTKLTIDKYHDITFPEWIGSLCKLKYLKIMCCETPMLPECICSLHNLQTLTLTRSNLKELPRKIGNLVSLEKLIINECHELKVLPESLCQLKALRKLCLIKCWLEALPSDLGRLTNLHTLEIRDTGVSYLPPSMRKVAGTQALKVDLVCNTIGWLKDFPDLEGTLCLRGLNKISNLMDLQCANLVSMHNLEQLILSWYQFKFWGIDGRSIFWDIDCSVLDLFIKSGHNILLEDQRYFSVMLSLQPHPNLRKLAIVGYCDITFPEWIGSLCKLKYLKITCCHSLQFLKAESLPLELEELEISSCDQLVSIPGIQKLKSLVKLSIVDCENLCSFMGPSLELTTCTGEGSLLGLTSLSSLRTLEISLCHQLQVLGDELPPVQPCNVEVSNCPGLKEWCLQLGINYEDW